MLTGISPQICLFFYLTGEWWGLWEGVRTVCTVLQSISGSELLTATLNDTHRTFQINKKTNLITSYITRAFISIVRSRCHRDNRNTLFQCCKCHITHSLYTIFKRCCVEKFVDCQLRRTFNKSITKFDSLSFILSHTKIIIFENMWS